MEFYDTFDDNGVFISSEDEQDVHYKGLWHKVIRVWLYDADGNLWLRRSKQSGKLVPINEVHLLSNESITRCFDRALFERLGIHLPATSKLESVGMKRMTVDKHFSDNSEFVGRYFLCDYVADFLESVKFFIFDQDTEAVVKCNAQGVLNLISSKASEIVGFEYFADSLKSENKIVVSYADIEKVPTEDTYSKYAVVVDKINKNAQKLARVQKEEEKLQKFASKDAEESHADENEGTEVY